MKSSYLQHADSVRKGHESLKVPLAKPFDLNREFVLGAIKSTVYRLDEVKQEVINAGLALKAGTITPQEAIDWVEWAAPGCLGYVPPATGLKVKRGANE
jgi:hypothetical protein